MSILNQIEKKDNEGDDIEALWSTGALRVRSARSRSYYSASMIDGVVSPFSERQRTDVRLSVVGVVMLEATSCFTKAIYVPFDRCN